MNSRRLLAALDRLTPSVRRDVERALRRLRRRLTESQLLDLLERGDAVVLGQALRSFERDLQPALTSLAQAFAVGRAVAATVLPVRVQMSFRQANPLAVRSAERQAARFVTAVSTETRAAIRTIIAEAMAGGVSVREAAKLVKPVIGLTKRQAKAVVNQRKADLAKGLTVEKAQARANRYAEKLLKQRALMIARTEVIAAGTQGQIALWRDAQERGFLPAGAEKRWVVTDDDRLCNRCLTMDGQTVPIAQHFVEGGVDGVTVPGPPLHPQCRCVAVLDAASIALRRAA